MSFGSDMDKFIGKTDGNFTKIVRKLVIDMGSRVVLRTPVGNPEIWKNPAPPGYVGGAARANWQYGNGVMPSEALSIIDASGSLTIAKISAGVRSFKAGSIHWIANNSPYIMPLEEGWSTQAPQGMRRLTILEFEETVNSIVREVA
mgnify:FL=1